MYKGFIYGSSELNHSTGNLSKFHLSYATKDDSHAIGNAIVQNIQGGDLGPYREWEARYGQHSTYTYRLFENKPFQATLKIGRWYTTAASAKVTVSWDDMECYMYMDDFWTFLPRLIFDKNLPDGDNMFITGKFVFVSKGGVVGLKEVV